MSDQQYDRFRRLERPRTAGPDQAPAPSGTGTRIEAVEGPGPGAPAGAEEAVSGGELGRFRAPPERSLELDRPGGDVQPFLRCATCETDNARTAALCTTCGADLDTEPQRRFNQRFWAARQAEAAAEAGAGAARRAELEREAVEAAALRRQAAEALAREVGDSERRRLDGEGFGEGAPAIRWLRSLPPRWPVPVGVAVLAVPVALYLASPLLGFLAGALLIGLFSPPGWRSRFGRRS